MRRIFLVAAVLLIAAFSSPYPIDGFEQTGIRRLERLRLIVEGRLGGTQPVPGARLAWSEITLKRTAGGMADMELPAPDPDLQKKIAALFAGQDRSYGLAVLDVTPGREPRFASFRENDRYAPGSVGKLAIAGGLFAELKRIFPNDTEARRELLKNHMVKADYWVRPNSHSIPVFDPATRAYKSRTVLESDVFSLYEWADHMISASSNAAASVMWKEVMLMRAFGADYPPSPEQERDFFAKTPGTKLREIALSVVNDPLRAVGIPEDAWQLGSMFTGAGKRAVPGAPSYGTPRALLTFLLRIEEGRLVDRWSSLEIKRLMYQTERRIRYASSPSLREAAVYFKSGSQYKCKAEEGFVCGKYMGNVENYMNSVATVEATDGRIYMVALMSNVFRKNSAADHQAFGTSIERIIASAGGPAVAPGGG